jgi:hypothetical protein
VEMRCGRVHSWTGKVVTRDLLQLPVPTNGDLKVLDMWKKIQLLYTINVNSRSSRIRMVAGSIPVLCLLGTSSSVAERSIAEIFFCNSGCFLSITKKTILDLSVL